MAWLSLRSEQVAVHGAEPLFFFHFENLLRANASTLKTQFGKWAGTENKKQSQRGSFGGFFLSFYHGFLSYYQMNESEVLARPSDIFSQWGVVSVSVIN